MGQQPNIELGLADLPRPTPHPGAPRRWKPKRPGELGGPDEVPWGGAFGTIGPDTGYALKLLAQRDIPVGPDENHHNVEVALATLMGARASHYGRAPVIEDAEVAEVLLGLGRGDAATDERRRTMTANIGHDRAKRRALVAAVDRDDLAADPADLRRRAEAGERFIDS
ncbi:MAG: hypothetical protein R3290_05630 [Acidimicrobiia bacterium]|nr:hypothetical protein [Acidimicrobiia bacterium]